MPCSVCKQHIAKHNTAEPTAQPSHHAIQNLTSSRPITWSVATWQHTDRKIGLRVPSVGRVLLHCASKAALLPRANQPGRQFVHPCSYSVEVQNSHSYTPFPHTSSLSIFTNQQNKLQRHTNVYVAWRHVTPCMCSLRLYLNERSRLQHNCAVCAVPTTKLFDGFSLNLAWALSMRVRPVLYFPIRTWWTCELERPFLH